MNYEEFKTRALSTEKVPTSLSFSRHGLVMLLEAGAMMADIADQMKKTMIYGKVFSEGDFRDKIGKLKDKLTTMQQRAHMIAIPEDQESPFYAPNLRIVHGAIGMFGEAGEILEAVAVGMETGVLDAVNLAEETGDSDWYKALIHDETGISEDQARTAVIEKLTNKLTGRYKNGFSEEAALNRDLNAERALLEIEVPLPVIDPGASQSAQV